MVFAAVLFRAGYRWLRGHDGLGFGDVKFVAAGTLWVGAECIPVVLLIGVVSALVSLLILHAQDMSCTASRRSRSGRIWPSDFGGCGSEDISRFKARRFRSKGAREKPPEGGSSHH